MSTTRTPTSGVAASVPTLLSALLALVGLAGCSTSAPPPPPAAVRHVATPAGAFGDAADAAGMAVEVSSVETDAGVHASLVVAGVTISEELWVGDVYYQRVEGAQHVLDGDRWIAFDLTDPDEAALAEELSLGLRRLAEQGGTHDIEPGRTIHLEVRRIESDHAPVIEPPPASAVRSVAHLPRGGR